MNDAPEYLPTDVSAEIRRRQNARSRVLGLVLAGLVVLFYAITVFRFPV